jgi:hypothetical protein
MSTVGDEALLTDAHGLDLALDLRGVVLKLCHRRILFRPARLPVKS